jgi:molybdopterin synthase sulfur carrier subunit
MKVRLRYFASLREALGAGEVLEVPDPAGAGPVSAAAVRRMLAARGGRHAELLAPGRAVRCAVNQVMAEDATLVSDGAEVAFFPPVTGG